jgi:hypothetical protein
MIEKPNGRSKEEVQIILKLHHQLSIDHDIIVLEKTIKSSGTHVLWVMCVMSPMTRKS